MASLICLRQLLRCGFCHIHRQHRDFTLAGSNLVWTSLELATLSLNMALIQDVDYPLLSSLTLQWDARENLESPRGKEFDQSLRIRWFVLTNNNKFGEKCVFIHKSLVSRARS